MLCLDGVYAPRPDGGLRFTRVKAPEREELEHLVQQIAARLGRALERMGLLQRDAESAWLDLPPGEDTDAMRQLIGSSVTYRIAVGPQAGRKALVLRTITAPGKAGESGAGRLRSGIGRGPCCAQARCEGNQGTVRAAKDATRPRQESEGRGNSRVGHQPGALRVRKGMAGFGLRSGRGFILPILRRTRSKSACRIRTRSEPGVSGSPPEL